MQLLANFIPAHAADDDDLIRLVPPYRASLDQRYPLVCEACRPTVDKAIANADLRARGAAIGAMLTQRSSRPRSLGASGRTPRLRLTLNGIAHCSFLLAAAARESLALLG
jgi:hypothetical protein